MQVSSLKLTPKAPENGWLEYDHFLLGWPVSRCELLVSGRVPSVSQTKSTIMV